MAAPRTIALARREPASAGTPGGSRRAQESDKRYDLHYAAHVYSAVVHYISHIQYSTLKAENISHVCDAVYS